MDKLVDEPPAEFVVLGVNSNKALAQTLRDMGCEERIVPKTGGNGFFTQLQSDGTYRDLPFPSWDLVAFYGTRSLVPTTTLDVAPRANRRAPPPVFTLRPPQLRQKRVLTSTST